MKKAFTLVEILVVIGVLGVLLGLILPALARAREYAKNTVVNADLYQIGLALEAYGLDNSGRFPPTRVSCMIQSHFYQLPDELVRQKYLPGRPDMFGAMSSDFEDRYNLGHTYKYLAPGDLIVNQGQKPQPYQSTIWVPDDFPKARGEQPGRFWRDPFVSPVSWAIFSLGPEFDPSDQAVVNRYYPVPKSTWYNSQTRKGILTRIRLRDGNHVGTFEGR